MTQSPPSPSAAVLDEGEASVRAALADLDRRAASEPLGDVASRAPAWQTTLTQLEGNLSGWQGILGDVSDRVRAAHDDLAVLDADLNQSLAAFSAARKYLQGPPAGR